MSADYPIGDPTGGAAYGEFNDPITAAVVVGSQVVGGMMQGDAAQGAADTQAAASDRAAQIQQETAKLNLAQQKQLFDIQNQQTAAGRGAGYQGLTQIRSMLPGQYTQYNEQGQPIGTATGQDYLTRQFTAEDFQKNIDPGYAFRLQQGQLANQAAANKAGGLIGGNALAGLNEYNQGMASQEYGNAFNRFQSQRSNIYNTLASIAGIGQTSQQQANQAASSYGTAAGNIATNLANAQTGLITGAGAAQAAGQVGAANAYGNALGNVGNTYMFSQMMKNPTAGRFIP
jgi:hypothetical protein